MRQTIVGGAAVIGASEMGVVLGLNPYKAPIELWQEKRGVSPGFTGNEQTEWGLDVEPAVRSWYVRRAGRAVYVPPASMFHVDHPWMRATPDGIVLDDQDAVPTSPANWLRGFEAKKAGRNVSHYWGEPGTDEVPLWYLIQCQQGMAVTGLDAWDLAASVAGEPPSVYRIARDEDLIGTMMEEGEKFLGYIERGEPPPIDGTAAYATYLAHRYPWSREDFIPATPEIEELVDTLRSLRTEQRERERVVDVLENQIKAFVADAAGVQTSIGRLTYKPRAGGPNWKAVAIELAQSAGVEPDLLAQLADENRNAASRPLVTPRGWSSK